MGLNLQASESMPGQEVEHIDSAARELSAGSRSAHQQKDPDTAKTGLPASLQSGAQLPEDW